MKSFAFIVGQCLLIIGFASTLALGLNALRTEPLPWVAPFPYEQQCKDKGDVPVPLGDSIEIAQLLQGQKIANRIVLIDARPDDLFKEKHLAEARSLPYSIFNPATADDAKALRAFAFVVVYCDSPGDALAKRLAAQLKSLGLAQVKVLKHGAKALAK